MIEFPTDVVRIAICGDWHANYQYAQKAVGYALRKGADVILHVGDFGAWKDGGYLDRLNEMCAEHNAILMFVDGNHEHHVWLNTIPVDPDGVRRLTERVWHLPRGFRWEWYGVTFLALGGAHSVDKPWRTEGIDWFPEETIKIADAYRAVQGGLIDVMLTHDCPAGVPIPGLENGKNYFPEEQLDEAERHRALLRAVVDEVKPRFLYHGHYHKCYREVLDLGDRRCIVTGLDMDKTPFEQNVQIADVYMLAEWWVE